MTDLAWILLAAAGVFAAGDWSAVAGRLKRLEYVCKPAALAGLIAVAIAVEPRLEARRWAFVVALGFALAGDVFLMLPRDRFVPGLASFFVAHVAYVVGMRIGQTSVGPLLVGAAIVFVVAAFLGRRILQAVRLTRPELATPVSAYIAVISVMVASGLATGEPLAATGAALFMASDTLIAWHRFVRPVEWAPVTIMVTYHLGQAGIVLSLAL